MQCCACREIAGPRRLVARRSDCCQSIAVADEHRLLFLALALAELSKFTHLPVIAAVASAGAVIAVPGYATLAFRRVYGGSLGGTIMKELAIGVIYAAVSIVAFIVMVYWVSVSA